jgi:hypothetical protein
MRSGLIQQSGIYAVQRFARTLQQDITAVKNALTERWSMARPKDKSTG